VLSNANIKTTIERLVGVRGTFSAEYAAKSKAVRPQTTRACQVYLGNPRGRIDSLRRATCSSPRRGRASILRPCCDLRGARAGTFSFILSEDAPGFGSPHDRQPRRTPKLGGLGPPRSRGPTDERRNVSSPEHARGARSPFSLGIPRENRSRRSCDAERASSSTRSTSKAHPSATKFEGLASEPRSSRTRSRALYPRRKRRHHHVGLARRRELRRDRGEQRSTRSWRLFVEATSVSREPPAPCRVRLAVVNWRHARGSEPRSAPRSLDAGSLRPRGLSLGRGCGGAPSRIEWRGTAPRTRAPTALDVRRSRGGSKRFWLENRGTGDERRADPREQTPGSAATRSSGLMSGPTIGKSVPRHESHGPRSTMSKFGVRSMLRGRYGRIVLRHLFLPGGPRLRGTRQLRREARAGPGSGLMRSAPFGAKVA